MFVVWLIGLGGFCCYFVFRLFVCFVSCLVQLEVRDGDSSRSSFIVENCFCYPKFLFFQMNLQIALSISVNNCVGILIGIVLNL